MTNLLHQVEMGGVEKEGLPNKLSAEFLDGKYVGQMTTLDGEVQQIRGIRWGESTILYSYNNSTSAIADRDQL